MHSRADIAKTVYFTTVSVLMYYFITQIINVGLFISYRHAFAAVLAFSAFVCFLHKPNIARGVVAAKGALVYSVPLLVTLVVSLFIWFTEYADTAVISRGLSGSIVYSNMLTFALAAAALLYVFGEKGIWYNLAAILVSNILMILTIIAQYGIASYFSELITLIKTFAAETGEIIVRAEIHELAFCLGAYLVYMLLKPQRSITALALFLLTIFCFLSAFKRIAMIAIAAALVLGYVLKLIARYKKKAAIGAAMLLSVLIIALLIGYVALIKAGAFELLEQMGIDTSGRVEIYSAVDKYYEFSPGFLGNGIGFLTYRLNTGMHVGVSAVHNDFLQYFIDLGFWGYILWLASMTLLRVKYFANGENADGAIVTFCLLVYLIIVSTTDNTMNYPLLTCVLAVLMIGCGFDERVRQQEKKMFGYISAPNREQVKSK